MTIKIKHQLIAIIILAIIWNGIVIFLPSSVLRLIVGFPFLVFLPGYVLISAMFPKSSHLDSMERIGLSFVVSVSIVSFAALFLNVTSWGIKLYPLLFSITIFTIVASISALLRLFWFTPQDRFSFSFSLNLPAWRKSTTFNKALFIILVLTMLATVGTFFYMAAVPRVGERFTEFYVLGAHGKMENYPTTAVVGQETKVKIGVVNWEHAETNYLVEIDINGNALKKIGPLALAYKQKWEQEVSFTPVQEGNSQKVEILLYKNQEVKPYRSLHLWIDVFTD